MEVFGCYLSEKNMLVIILQNIALVVCIFLTVLLMQKLFDDKQKVMKWMVGFVVFPVLLFGARSTIDRVFGGIDIEKELASDPVYATLKLKHPREYQQIIRELKVLENRDNYSDMEMMVTAQQRLASIINKIIIEAGDGARSKYVTSYVKSLQLLKDRDETACYDVLYAPQNLLFKFELLNQANNDSGVKSAIMAVINDNGVDKAVVSKKVMEQTLDEVYKEIKAKYDERSYLFSRPEDAITTTEKRIVCDMRIELYSRLNTNSKAKKATLRYFMKKEMKL